MKSVNWRGSDGITAGRDEGLLRPLPHLPPFTLQSAHTLLPPLGSHREEKFLKASSVGPSSPLIDFFWTLSTPTLPSLKKIGGRGSTLRLMAQPLALLQARSTHRRLSAAREDTGRCGRCDRCRDRPHEVHSPRASKHALTCNISIQHRLSGHQHCARTLFT